MKPHTGLFLLLLLASAAALGAAPAARTYVPVTIDNRNNAENLTDYTVLVKVNTAQLIAAGLMNADGSDIRFTTDFTDDLPYWIEPGIGGARGMNTDTTYIWVKVPYIPASARSTIHLSYGEPAAAPRSDITKAFLFGDDFNDNTLDAVRWIAAADNLGSASEQNGRYEHQSPKTTPQSNTYLASRQKFTGSVMFEGRFRKGGYIYRRIGLSTLTNDNTTAGICQWQDFGEFGVQVHSGGSTSGTNFRTDSWAMTNNPEYYVSVARRANGTFVFDLSVPSTEPGGPQAWHTVITDRTVPADTGLRVFAYEGVWVNSPSSLIRYEDDLRVRKYSEPEPAARLGSDLAAYYPFTGSASDNGPNGLHGTVSGASLTADRFGVANRAYAFDGVNDRIVVGDPVPAPLQIQNEITLSAWIKIAAMPAELGMIVGSQYDGMQSGASIFVDNRTNADGQVNPAGHIHFQIGNGGWHVTNSSTVLPVGTWVMVTATRKSGEAGKIYYNNILQSSSSVGWTGAVSYSGAWFAMGDQKDMSRPFNGSIDDVRIFNRALSASEVDSLYRLGGYDAAPAVSGFDPPSGAVGSSVTITGSNFGASQGSGSVKFGAAAAGVASWSDTQINAVVPSLAAGAYTITVTTGAGSAASASQYLVTGTAAAYPEPLPAMVRTVVPTTLTTGSIDYMIERSGNLWLSGENGLVARAASIPTAGSPVTWTVANSGIPSTETVYAMDFLSGGVGLAGTGTGKIYRTTDNGASWTLVYNSPATTDFINSIKFFNTTNAVAVGDGIGTSTPTAMAFLSSTNGGLTWVNNNSYIVGTTYPSAVSFPVQTAGYLTGYKTVGSKNYRGLWKTTDVGASWNFQSVGTASADSMVGVSCVSFRTATAGVAVKSDSTVWKTSNGGTSWQKVGQLPRLGYGIAFVSASTVYITGRNGMTAQVDLNASTVHAAVIAQDALFAVPSYSAAIGGLFVPDWGFTRTYYSTVNPGTALATPTLMSPTGSTVVSAGSTALNWTSVSGATAYDVEVGTAISSSIRGRVFTASTTQWTVSGLSPGTVYQWRVRARSVSNSSAWSAVASFISAAQRTVSVVPVSYPKSPSAPTDYRLVTIPSTLSQTVGTFLNGSSPADFRLFRDNGGTPPSHLSELTGAAVPSVGEGYWLVKKGDLLIEGTLSHPSPSASTGLYAVATRVGWNIIGNPYPVPVKWSDVRSANGLAGSAMAYAYEGTGGFQQADILKPYTGYYYFSGTTTLLVPFPFADTPDLSVQRPAFALTLEHRSDAGTDRTLVIGTDDGASAGMDEFDERKPPVFGDQTAVWLDRPDWDPRHPRFASDIRPALGEGQRWDIVLQQTNGTSSRLIVHGGESLPEGYSVIVMDGVSGAVLTPDAERSVSVPARESAWPYRVIVGRREFIRAQMDPTAPVTFALHQNFPNPFNPATTIRLSLAEDAVVTVEVYDLLGRRTAEPFRGPLLRGVHDVPFDASGLSSSTYFYTVRAVRPSDGAPLFSATKKMLLLR